MQHGERLRKLRITLGLSADKMAAALGFTGANRKDKVRAMERNARDISEHCLDEMVRLERDAGIKPTENERLDHD